MAQTEKTADKPAPYTPTWTVDPWVVVSKRTRDIDFPAVLLTRDATTEEMTRWLRDPQEKYREPGAPINAGAAARVHTFSVTLGAGVTILGALTTQWRHLDVVDMSRRPRNPPNIDDCNLVYPVSTAGEQIRKDDYFKARDAEGRPDHEVVDPNRVADAWRRVMRYLEAQEKALVQDGTWLAAPLFSAQRGFDAPELTVGRLGDFLLQRTEEARRAYPFLAANYKGCRDGRHMGAFHDYCVRSDHGWDFVAKAREVLHMRPGLAR